MPAKYATDYKTINSADKSAQRSTVRISEWPAHLAAIGPADVPPDITAKRAAICSAELSTLNAAHNAANLSANAATVCPAVG